MPLRRLLPLLLCFLSAQTIVAQTILIKGSVQDANTQAALVGAVVQEKGREEGVITDQNGQFELILVGNTRSLKVSHVGYETQFHICEQTDAPQIIRLSPSAIEMPTTTITSGRLETVHPNRQLHILDYHFVGDDIAVIVRDMKEKRNKLEVMDLSGKSIDVLNDLAEEPRSLSKDCLGILHVLTKRFAWQLDYLDEMLIPRRDSLHIWRQTVTPCTALLDSTYFFAYEPQPHVRQFIFVRSDEKRKRHLYATADSHAIAIHHDESLMPGRFISPGLLVHRPRKGKPIAALDRASLDWLLLHPPYIPLKVVNDQALVFDHHNKKILKFNPRGEQVGQVQIQYPMDKHWKRRIITDEKMARAYSVYEKNGTTTLREIDLSSGKAGRSWELPKQFVKNIKIQEGYAYFLYRDGQYAPIQKLYRFKM